jgi:hypothetical protein
LLSSEVHSTKRSRKSYVHESDGSDEDLNEEEEGEDVDIEMEEKSDDDKNSKSSKGKKSRWFNLPSIRSNKTTERRSGQLGKTGTDIGAPYNPYHHLRVLLGRK